MRREFDADKLSRVAEPVLLPSGCGPALVGVPCILLPSAILLLEGYGALAFIISATVIPAAMGAIWVIFLGLRGLWSRELAPHINTVLVDQGLLRIAMLDNAAERLPALSTAMTILGITLPGSAPRTFQARMERLAMNYERCARSMGLEPLPQKLVIWRAALTFAGYVAFVLFAGMMVVTHLTGSEWIGAAGSALVGTWMVIAHITMLLGMVARDVAAKTIVTALGGYE